MESVEAIDHQVVAGALPDSLNELSQVPAQAKSCVLSYADGTGTSILRDSQLQRDIFPEVKDSQSVNRDAIIQKDNVYTKCAVPPSEDLTCKNRSHLNQRDSNPATDSHTLIIAQRTPGFAKRVEDTPQQHTQEDDVSKPGTNIDALSKTIAENLLVRPMVQSPPKYVSLNQMEEQRQKHLLSHRVSTEIELEGRKVALSYDAAEQTNSNSGLPAPLRDLTASLINTSITANLAPAVANDMPSSLNRLCTDWTNSNGLSEQQASQLASAELDVLTAMSGSPNPTTLPHVMDGLSDDDISADEDSSESDAGSTDPVVLQQVPAAKGRMNPFLTNQQSTLRMRSPEQLAVMRATIRDIQLAAQSMEPVLFDGKTSPTNHSDDPLWRIRDSYAEKLRLQELKRKQRIELEKQYEQEYRERQLEELYKLEQEDHRLTATQALPELEVAADPVSTDYSSDEDENEAMGQDPEQGKSWGWPPNRKYSRVGADHYETVHTSTASSQVAKVSCASRLAEHAGAVSPGSTRKKFPGDPKCSSTGSLNSFSSSSQSSSVTPSTMISAPGNDRVGDSAESSSSSTSSWESPDQPGQVRISRKAPKSVDGTRPPHVDYDTDDETDKLLHKPYEGEAKVVLPESTRELAHQAMKNKAKEVAVYDPDEPTVLIEGILFRASYLGSTQLVSENQPSKALRMMQAQEAVGRIKAPAGENQPSTAVDLFVSTEKVMVLNTDLKEIMMDHTLRSISYIADIDSILVIMAKRNLVSTPTDEPAGSKQHKLICHVFETDEAQLIAQSIGQAFQVAYMEFLRANGVDNPALLKDTSYEDILDQQEIMNDELETFTSKDKQKEVIVPKAKHEPLGVVIVESGWGSVLPTVVLANMSPTGPAARCGQLNIGDQIMSINGLSLVGLPLATCQEHIKATRHLLAVRLCVVSRPPVVEVLIKRPDRKYQLGFSVQNGVICSLLRGGIAERGGIRVGHRIIEINGQSVVAVPHDKIVHILSTSIGEIHMKTMPMAVFKLLTGQEIPHYI